MFYIHRHEVTQWFGGHEEGGWWYTQGIPDDAWNPTLPHRCFHDEETAYLVCRYLNERERQRQAKEEEYGFTSVLSHRSTFYEYSVEDMPEQVPFPATRPHYE